MAAFAARYIVMRNPRDGRLAELTACRAGDVFRLTVVPDRRSAERLTEELADERAAVARLEGLVAEMVRNGFRPAVDARPTKGRFLFFNESDPTLTH